VKHSTASLLRALVVFLGVGAFAFLLWEPIGEGVNAQATTFSDIYLDDPFLAYAYIASIPFFVGLYQAFKFLGATEQKNVAVKALQSIKYCALTMIPFILGGVVWLLFVESDDRPPILMMGLVATIISIAVANAARVLEKEYE